MRVVGRYRLPCIAFMEVRDDETNTIASQAVMGAGWHTPESLCALYHIGYLGRGLWMIPYFAIAYIMLCLIDGVTALNTYALWCGLILLGLTLKLLFLLFQQPYLIQRHSRL